MIDDLGINHFSFWADDLDALERRLLVFGTEILMKPIAISPDYQHERSAHCPRGGAYRTMLFRDPDGIPDGIVLRADERVEAP